MSEIFFFPSQTKVAQQVGTVVDVFQQSHGEVRPHMFITGPSGSGKSHIVSAIAADRKIPFVEINAAQLTTEGVSGNSLSKAIKPMQNYSNQPNILFVDEFDKLMQRNGSSTQEYSMGVQDEFLHMLESNETQVFGDYGKYFPMSVRHTLFIFAGAFSGKKIDNIKDLAEVGMRKEFLGRIPVITQTQKVPFHEMKPVIQNCALIDEYLTIYRDGKDRYEIVKDIENALAALISEYDIGIRGINTVVHNYFINGNYKKQLKQVETRKSARLITKRT